MELKAYAKVNFGLKILGKRKDGYHNIQSIFLPINFFDRIELTVGARCTVPLRIEFISNSPPYGKDNLCVKSAELFLKRTKITTAVKIRLDKQIWIGAGLGGGSSCAAKTLVGMNDLFGNPLTQEELLELALKIGSDVPFFISGIPSFVGGRGEIITPLPALAEPIWLVLVYPNFSVSTKWAYSKIGNYLTKEEWDFKVLQDLFIRGEIKGVANNLHNDFELLVFHKYPELQRVKEKLLELGALGATLTGSGSCVYGIFEKEEQMEDMFPNYEVKVVNSRVV